MRRRTLAFVSIAFVLSLGSAQGVAATSQRTFVASTGNDANPCSLTLPCRGFATAIAAVANRGEVIVLDSAGYGSFAITSSVSITAPDGVYAGISVPTAGIGISISISASDTVTLRGLTFFSQSGTSTAILFGSEGTLEIDRVRIGRMASGISITGGGTTVIRNSALFGNFAGISSTSSIFPTGLTIENTTIVDSGFAAVYVIGNVALTIDRSKLINGNHSWRGVHLITPPPNVAPIRAHISNSTIEGFDIGIAVEEMVPSSMSVTVAGCDVVQNNIALRVQSGQVAVKGNRFSHNTTVFEADPAATIFTSGDNYVAYYTTLQTGGGTFAPPSGSY